MPTLYDLQIEVSDAAGNVTELIQDLTTMKRNNINAIRTCHYPDASAIYELCDEYGIYLIAENNMETHGTWDMFPVTGDPDLVVWK